MRGEATPLLLAKMTRIPHAILSATEFEELLRMITF